VYQSDWLLRQIEQMGDVLRRLVAALREHRPEDALTLSREAIEEILDTEPELIDALSGQGLLTLLSAGGEFDEYRAFMLGEVLVARAATLTELGRIAEAKAEAERAAILLELLQPMMDAPEAMRIHELLGWLDVQ